MTHALQARDEWMTPEEYLEWERLEEIKHEYLGGMVYEMAGASVGHNRVAANLNGLLHLQLRGGPCEAFGSDMKVKVLLAGDTRFYYPDAMVARGVPDAGRSWLDRPSFIFEIISETTRPTDEREKRMAYRQIESLQAYVRLEQSRPEVVVESRSAGGWQSERFAGLEAVVQFAEPALTLRLADLYERLEFPGA